MTCKNCPFKTNPQTKLKLEPCINGVPCDLMNVVNSWDFECHETHNKCDGFHKFQENINGQANHKNIFNNVKDWIDSHVNFVPNDDKSYPNLHNRFYISPTKVIYPKKVNNL